jgi:tetratricopeptide (TPR) repeat protein
VTATPQAQLPFRLGQYEVLAPIAEGGMASVWLARTAQRPKRCVALKLIRPEHARNKDFIAMFLDEARIASRLSHPNIVRLEGLGHDGKRHFLTMEVLYGCTLLDAWQMARSKRLRMAHEVVAWIGARIAGALHYAHDLTDDGGAPQNVVHRDVNPANIFLTGEGTPKLIDFGLARARDRVSSTAAGVVKGKLAYLSPEQTRGHPADRRADVFALCVTLWELTLDRRLFREEDDAATVRRVFEAQVPDPSTLAPGYPRALADALVRGLAREPADRWQTAAELRDALDAYVGDSARAVDEGSVRAIVAELTSDREPAAWEQLADEGGVERLRVWDEDRQKLTWMPATIETVASVPPPASRQDAPAREEPRVPTRLEALEDALAARAKQLGAGTDALATSRSHMERALVDELWGDGYRAVAAARSSIETAPSSFAHAMLRRLAHSRGKKRDLVAHLDAEIALLSSDAARADLLAERARLLEAAGERPESVRSAWEAALAADPTSAAALKGLEGALSADARTGEALAGHLARMADAYTGEPRLAACLHVERARLLERDLRQPDAAKAALQRALVLDSGVGPVRAACVEHAAVHRDAAWLVALLQEEAALEADEARAARLELDAACVARHRLGDLGLAVALLERLAARSPALSTVRRRAIDELVVLHQAAGRPREAARVRRLRLALLDDARASAHELRAIAALHEALADPVAAVGALERALEFAPDDVATAEALDRLLECESLVERRARLWVRIAAASEVSAQRAACLVRAARLFEAQGDSARALEHLRAALVAEPSSVETVDALLRLLAPRAADAAVEEVRARIAIHAHAAEHARDPARRLAHLEAIALLQEERLSDAPAAASTYEAILRLEPGRRSATVGLARNAEHAGEPARVARALLDEADATASPASADALRVRAAEAMATTEPARALSLVSDILTRAPGNERARALEQRLHEAAGRWAQVDAVLAARIEHAPDGRGRVGLWLERAEVQRARLKATDKALASLRAALAIDPGQPAARAALIGLAEAMGDARALRDVLVELAPSEATADGRACAFARAAEIEELLLLDDERAAALYRDALAQAPGDPWIEERLARVGARLGRRERNPDDGAAAARAQEVLARDPSDVHALRALERAARVSRDLPLLARALELQANAFTAASPKLGALWALAGVLSRLPSADDSPVADRILQLAPADRAAVDAALRHAIPRARAGDVAARRRVRELMQVLVAQAPADTDRLCLQLGAALALDREDAGRDDDAAAALAHHREALRIDPRSVVAAAGAARLAAALGDAEATVAAAIAQGELATGAKQRATHWVGAAGRIVSSRDPRLGARAERLERAGRLLEQALDADPEALPAVALLVAIRSEDGGRDRLLWTLRSALERAAWGPAIVRLGSELARIASAEPADRVLAIETLRRVLTADASHGPTLRSLADLYLAQEAWGDAVEALEALATRSRDAHVRLGAHLERADVYARVLGRREDAARALQAALEVDPASVAALRQLLVLARAAQAPREELAPLLARVGDAETDPEAKAAALTELAQLRRAAGDTAGAERALVEAVAQAPNDARIALVFETHAEPSEQARVLAAAVARARALDRPDAATLAALGRLEVDALGRPHDGVAHLRAATALAPAMHDARAAWARGLLAMGVAGESLALLLPMLVPDAAPLLSQENPAALLATLEAALATEARREEAVVVRELRALGGGLDENAVADLRARKLPGDNAAPPAPVLDATTLRASVVPAYVPSLLLDVAAALAGAEGKIAQLGGLPAGTPAHAQADPAESDRVAARDRIPPTSGHPLIAMVSRLAGMLGIPRLDIALSDRGVSPRVVSQDAPWLVVPASLLGRPDAVQAAMLVVPLVRVALGVPWIAEVRGPALFALFCGAARLVVPGYAADLDGEHLALADETARRLARTLGRRQKRALAELAPALGATKAATPAELQSLELGVRSTELRAAFVVTGDLLATVEALRALDPDLAHATTRFGRSALSAVLTHAVASDLVRFALAPSTTALRWHARTLWSKAR